jgi:hypothetical protein
MHQSMMIMILAGAMIGCVSVKKPYEITIGKKANYKLEFKDGTHQYAWYFEDISDDSVYVYLRKEAHFNDKGRIVKRTRTNAVYSYAWDSLVQVKQDHTGKIFGLMIVTTVVVIGIAIANVAINGF